MSRPPGGWRPRSPSWPPTGDRRRPIAHRPALAAGGHDNITVAVIDIGTVDRRGKGAGVNFTAETHQNEYLAGGTAVDAVVSDRHRRRPQTRAASPTAVVLVLDISGSMAPVPRSRRPGATAAAIAATATASCSALSPAPTGARVVPGDPPLAVADDATRGPRRPVNGSTAGGTAIGAWLTVANPSGRGRRDPPGILLTDGEDQDETDRPRRRRRPVRRVFQCDCRGVGTDWDRASCVEIASALLGSSTSSPPPTTWPPTSRP